MTERHPWTQTQDAYLNELIQNFIASEKNKKLEWKIIAERFSLEQATDRTPRQCRDRWNNYLKPGLTKQNVWRQHQQQLVFSMQERLGNKWSLIASKLPGRIDNQIKNFFYSTLRKSLRRINNYILHHRTQTICRGLKVFSESTVSKIIAMSQGKTKRIRTNGDNIQIQARELRKLLLQLYEIEFEDETMKLLINRILDFNRNCRKVRGKRRQAKNSANSENQWNNEDESFKTEKNIQKINDQQMECQQKMEQVSIQNQQQNQDNIQIQENFTKYINQQMSKNQIKQIQVENKKQCSSAEGQSQANKLWNNDIFDVFQINEKYQNGDAGQNMKQEIQNQIKIYETNGSILLQNSSEYHKLQNETLLVPNLINLMYKSSSKLKILTEQIDQPEQEYQSTYSNEFVRSHKNNKDQQNQLQNAVLFFQIFGEEHSFM